MIKTTRCHRFFYVVVQRSLPTVPLTPGAEGRVWPRTTRHDRRAASKSNLSLGRCFRTRRDGKLKSGGWLPTSSGLPRRLPLPPSIKKVSVGERRRSFGDNDCDNHNNNNPSGHSEPRYDVCVCNFLTDRKHTTTVFEFGAIHSDHVTRAARNTRFFCVTFLLRSTTPVGYTRFRNELIGTARDFIYLFRFDVRHSFR